MGDLGEMTAAIGQAELDAVEAHLDGRHPGTRPDAGPETDGRIGEGAGQPERIDDPFGRNMQRGDRLRRDVGRDRPQLGSVEELGLNTERRGDRTDRVREGLV